MEPDSAKLRVYLAAHAKRGIFHPKWAPPFREVLEAGVANFREQPFDEADRILSRQRWFRGDAATLAQVTAPFAWNKKWESKSDQISVSFYAPGKVVAHQPTSTATPLKADSSIFPKAIVELIGAHFKLGGVAWSNEHESDVRKFWELLAARHTVPIRLNPTAHEKLEAYLFLRAWLRPKVSPSQFDEIWRELQN